MTLRNHYLKEFFKSGFHWKVSVPPWGLVLHCSLTLVSNSLAWDWVPVETQRLLPSNQKHQEQDLRPAHGSHVSSHSSELALSDGSSDQSVDQRDPRENSPAPGSLPRERKTNTSAGSSNSLPLLARLFIRNYFARTVFTTCTFFKSHTKTLHTFKLHRKINVSLWEHVQWNLTWSSKSTIM